MKLLGGESASSRARKVITYFRDLLSGSKRFFARHLLRKSKRLHPCEDEEEGGPVYYRKVEAIRVPDGWREFSYEEIKEITSGFSDDLLGENTAYYSSVYRGKVPEGPNRFRDVIVETWETSYYGISIFNAQVRMITDPVIGSHPNVVKLYGFCKEEDEDFLSLVYDCQALGTLCSVISDGRFTWAMRTNATLQVAQFLEFLHSQYQSDPLVVRILDPTNILLDKNWCPIVFGLGVASGGFLGDRLLFARPLIIMSPAFTDPNIYISGFLQPPCDVHSFGSLLLALFTKSEETIDYAHPFSSIAEEVFGPDFSLDKYTRELIQESFNGSEGYNFEDGIKIISLAVKCIGREPAERPLMSEIVNHLSYMLQVQKLGLQQRAVAC